MTALPIVEAAEEGYEDVLDLMESPGSPSVVAEQAQRVIAALDDHGRNSGVFLDKDFPPLTPGAHAYDAMTPVMSWIKRRVWSDLVRDSRKPASDAQDLFHRLDAFVAALRAAVGGSKRGELTVPADRPRYHRPDEPRPEKYPHGPLTGTNRGWATRSIPARQPRLPTCTDG
jgi:hypothetical protein